MCVDFDPQCEYAYEHNNRARFLNKSVADLTPDDVRANFRPGHISLLAGCAPCQTFSKYNQKATWHDKRWHLLHHFQRLVEAVLPDLVTMENVPRLADQAVFDRFRKKLSELGYSVDFRIVNCPDYGLPQLRQRLVLVASRLGPIAVPAPNPRARRKTVRSVIGNLPPLRAGETDPNDRLHFCAALSPLNLRRIRASRPGGSWRDWPADLVAECHRKKAGKGYGGVYGRMRWDKPAPTMTTQFYGFGNGRFGHPDQDRGISVREGAMFQGFPRDYQFLPPGAPRNISQLGKMIGNAVPVKLGELIGRTFREHLDAIPRDPAPPTLAQ